MSDETPQQTIASRPSDNATPVDVTQKSAMQDGKRKDMARRRSVVVAAPAADADAEGSEETEASRLMK